MTTNTDIKKDIQDLNVGSPLVSLFRIDATNYIGGSVYYFISATNVYDYVYFNSIKYSPLPVEFEGLEQSEDGKMARPTVTISNVTYLLLAEVITYKGLTGCKLVRTRTYKKYLDGESEADPTAKFPDDVFYVNKRLKQSKYGIQWELRSALDLENILIPKRQCIANCNYRYLGVNNVNSTCPYDGSNGYYTTLGVVTDEDGDECGKTLTDCKLRFKNDPLPTRGFPGIGNFGIPFR